MATGSVNPPFPLFFCVWAAFAIAAAAFFQRSRNVKLKRRLWLPFSVVGGIVFLGIAWTYTRSVQVLYILVPLTCFSAWMSRRAIRFCDACGETIRARTSQGAPEFCPKCGAHLKD